MPLLQQMEKFGVPIEFVAKVDDVEKGSTGKDTQPKLLKQLRILLALTECSPQCGNILLKHLT